MSFTPWTVEGVGISVNTFAHRIDEEKLFHKIQEVTHTSLEGREEDPLEDLILDVFGYSDYYIDPEEYPGLLFGYCAEERFIFFPPAMPWQRKENEPKTLEEVHQMIVKLVCSITDMTADEVLKEIDDDLLVVDES